MDAFLRLSLDEQIEFTFTVLNNVRDPDEHIKDGLPNDGNQALSLMLDTQEMTHFTAGDLLPCCYVKLSDGGNALYRLLWAFKPQGLSFGDMYKHNLFTCTTKDGRFTIMVSLHKYNPALTLYAHPDDIALIEAMSVSQMIYRNVNAPGILNDRTCVSHTGNMLLAAVKQFAETKHDVYLGNDFRV